MQYDRHRRRLTVDTVAGAARLKFLAAAPPAAPGRPAAAAAAGTLRKVGTLTGYAIVWNVLSTDRGGYRVRILPGAARFATPTHALWHHEWGEPLACTTNRTLRIFPDSYGVRVEIDLADTGRGRDTAELVSRGDVRGMSFAMVSDPEAERVTERGVGEVLNVRGFLCDEVTVTPAPAFAEARVGVAGPDGPFPGYSSRAAQRLRLELARLQLAQWEFDEIERRLRAAGVR